jgi:hypothetical protein
MEPPWTPCRPKRMYADTDAIRALGATNAAHADALTGIAAALWSLPVAPGSSLGPVASRFVSALAEAAADGARAVTVIGHQLTLSEQTAKAVASTYDSADSEAGARIADV